MSDAVEGSNLVASAKMPARFREDVQDAPLCEMKVAVLDRFAKGASVLSKHHH